MTRTEEMTVEEFPGWCHGKGLKCTAQRLAVFAAIRLSHDHPSVDATWESVAKTLPTITRTSVYRILNEFADAGLISRMDALTAARYDTCTAPHAHFICEKCGAVTDYPMPPHCVPPSGLPGEVHHLELRISGVCQRCAAAQ